MEIAWLDPEHPEHFKSRDVAAAVTLLEAARAVDSPHEVPSTLSTFAAHARHGWDGNAPHIALARKDGRVVGVLEIDLPTWDNTNMAFVQVTIDPLVRRRGFGRQLFEAGVAYAKDNSRSLVLAESWDPAPGVPFLETMGLERASVEVKRSQHLLRLDAARLAEEFAVAAERAAGYELLRMPGRTPEELLADVVTMTGAINDAPLDDLAIEDEVFTPERIRAFEGAQLAQNRRMYRLVARERNTGVLAGHTVVSVPAEQPWHGYQFDTSVVREHRGHRLGLYLKIAMLHWLAEAEPQLRTVSTWNAASNDHMISVNEAMGYEVVAKAIAWQRRY